MRIKHLLLTVIALPLLFVACKQNDPVDEVKNPTIELSAGEATESSLSFTITTTEAESVAWLAIEASEATPTASEVLANGTKVEANKSVECSATDLEQNTEYTIVAAVKNSKAVDKKEIKMTTEASDPASTQFKRKSAAEAEFTAEGGKGEIEYEIVNPIEGTEVEAEADVEWIAVTVGEKIAFVVEGNTSTEAREGKITATYGDLSFDVKVKQAAKPNDQPVDEEVNFTASVYEVQYYGTEYSAAYNYLVYLSDNGLNEDGIYKQNGEYYMLDIYAADSAENNSYTLPNGKYNASETPNAGTFGIGDFGAHIKVVDGVPTYTLYKQGTVTVSDGKIEAKIMMEDGTVHNVLYEGNLRFDGKEPDDPDNPDQPSDNDVVLEATSWTWGGSSSYGNKYSVAGNGFSLDVHFPAKYATEETLATGDYIWTNTSWWGYNDFENEFTTRSFLIDGAYASIVKEGTASVAVEGDVYTIELKLKAETANYLVKYSGKLSDTMQGGGDEGDEVVFTKIESLGYNSAYYFYEYKLTNEAGDAMQLCVNDYQAKENFIYTDDAFEWISIGYCGNLGFFSTRNIVVGGTSYNATSGSMAVVTDEATYHMDITVNLLLNAGGAKTFKFSGKVGDNGGDTPAEPTKLDTPSVSGLVSGNAATISWQAIAGAKDYSVSLNGTFLQTVESAYIVLNDLEYSTTYSVSVVANPADSSVNTASDAGTASFTTEADPNAGGDEPGDDEPATDFIDWHFSAHYNTDNCVVTLTGKDDSRVITVKTNDLAFAKFYADTTHSNYFTDATVDGVATSDVTAESYVHIQQTQVSINLVINGITYTGNSDGFSY
ncbi:MAG: BACON domain-containing protein [Alistipes sp.]|nr:BACON domain-containing protein [Alistipes sp.]